MTFSPALAQRWFPARTWYREAGVVCGGIALLAALAQASVPLLPVPVTGQTLAVFLVGGWLGFRRGVAAVAGYIALGAAGAPIFAGGSGGPAVLVGPTAGYLVGFLVAAGTVGLLGEHGFLRTFPKALLTIAVATLSIFAFGLAWLAAYVPAGTLLGAGFWPFLPGAVAKAAIALLVLVPTDARARSRARARVP